MRGRQREQAANGRCGYAKRRRLRIEDFHNERRAARTVQAESRFKDLMRWIKGAKASA